MTDHNRLDPARRALLRRLGLGTALAYIAPALTPFSAARASGGSGGGSGGGEASDGASDGASVSAPGRPGQSRRPDARPSVQPAPERPVPPPELVAVLPANLPRDALLAAGFRVLTVRPGFGGGDLMRLGLPAGRSPEEARAELASLVPAATVDINHLYTPDEFLCRDGLCAAHETVGWSGWPSAFAPKIGMIDTGINVDHEALAGQNLVVRQADLSDRDAAGRQHGTAVAAILIGRLDSPVPGLLPYAELVAVDAFHATAQGDAADAFALSEALQILADEGVSVVNLSFSGPENAVLGQVVQEVLAAGIGLVAAAGNEGPGALPVYPAAWPGVIAVTAVDSARRPYRQAARGAHIAFAAPGVNLWTAASIRGGRLRSGTSYAAPFVTAALAVERKRMGAETLGETVARMAACAIDQGDPGRDEIFGHGVLSSPQQCLANSASEIPADFRLSGE